MIALCLVWLNPHTLILSSRPNHFVLPLNITSAIHKSARTMGQCQSTSATASEASSRALSSSPTSSFTLKEAALPAVRTSAKEAHHEPSGLTMGSSSLDSHSTSQVLKQLGGSAAPIRSKNETSKHEVEKSQESSTSVGFLLFGTLFLVLVFLPLLTIFVYFFFNAIVT